MTKDNSVNDIRNYIFFNNRNSTLNPVARAVFLLIVLAELTGIKTVENGFSENPKGFTFKISK